MKHWYALPVKFCQQKGSYVYETVDMASVLVST